MGWWLFVQEVDTAIKHDITTIFGSADFVPLDMERSNPNSQLVATLVEFNMVTFLEKVDRKTNSHGDFSFQMVGRVAPPGGWLVSNENLVALEERQTSNAGIGGHLILIMAGDDGLDLDSVGVEAPSAVELLTDCIDCALGAVVSHVGEIIGALGDAIENVRNSVNLFHDVFSFSFVGWCSLIVFIIHPPFLIVNRFLIIS